MSYEVALSVEGLRVDLVNLGADIIADVDLSVPAGGALGIVGESGSGKTTLALALLGFARPGTRITSGEVRVAGIDLLAVSEDKLRRLRGGVITYVPQNPARALSPGMRIRAQLEEMVRVHSPGGSAEEMLADAWRDAQLPSEHEFGSRYPHELSGGQQQRVAIAMALVCRPAVVVMDEPTTGLDVLTQDRLLRVVRDLRAQREISVVYVTHDLAVVRNLVDTVAVMYGGRLVEIGETDDIFRSPQHPYTRRLLEAVPRIRGQREGLRGIPGHAVEPWQRPRGCPFSDRCDFRIEICAASMPPLSPTSHAAARCWRVGDLSGGREVQPARHHAPSEARLDAGGEPVLSVRSLVAGYRGRRDGAFGRRELHIAVDSVSFDLWSGRCLAIVGASGSGKTTLARCIVGLHEPEAGEMLFQGAPLAWGSGRRDTRVRRAIQIVFQDPDSSLNPSISIGDTIRRPLRQFCSYNRREETRNVARLLEQVHLSPGMATRLPAELSGGEKQRVAIARAIAAAPDLLVCDEITSALDVAVQANILQLLRELRESSGISVIFVSHDLAVVRAVCDEILVMRDGSVCELAPRDTILNAPHAAYTRSLLAAAPDLTDGDYPTGSASGDDTSLVRHEWNG